MGRVVLITDAQTPLGEELVKVYLAGGYSVAATRSNQERTEAPLVSQDEGFLLIDWNRRSPFSARNVLLTTLNRFGCIDLSLVLECPALERKLLQELSFETIERAVDGWIKGSLFLIKGLLEYFGQRPGGRLALVHHVPQESGTTFPPLEGALRGSFQGTARALFAGSGQKGLLVNGFEAYSADPNRFAEFIYQSLELKGERMSGKWFRFSPRRFQRILR